MICLGPSRGVTSPYFSQLPLEGPPQLRTHLLCEQDYLRWINIHPAYLSPYECFALGTKLLEQNNHQISFEKKLNYLQIGHQNTSDDELKSWLMVAIGIAYFERSLLAKKREQKRLLNKASICFQQANEHHPFNDHARLYQVLVLVAQDKLEIALKSLYRVQTLLNERGLIDWSLPLYEILAKIYAYLGLERVSKFYLSRLRSRKVPLSTRRNFKEDIQLAS